MTRPICAFKTVCLCVRACVCACVCVCVRACLATQDPQAKSQHPKRWTPLSRKGKVIRYNGRMEEVETPTDRQTGTERGERQQFLCGVDSTARRSVRNSRHSSSKLLGYGETIPPETGGKKHNALGTVLKADCRQLP